MKLLIMVLICLIATTAMASNVLIYDEATGELKSYLRSVNTPDFSSRSDCLINPDVSIYKTVDRKYLRVQKGIIVEIPQAEQDAIDSTEAQAVIDARNASVENLEISVYDLGLALVQLNVVNGDLLKAKIKENKGLI